jgi:peptide/nickel transport system substrate-binding protein
MAQAGDSDNLLVGSSEDWPLLDEYVGAELTYDEYMAGEPLVESDPEKPFIKIYDILSVNSRTDVGFNFVTNDEGGNSYMGSGVLDGDGINAEFFSDPAVRRAFNYCFDYDTYLEEVLQGEAERAPTLMLPGMSGYDEDASQFTYDIEKCQEELKNSYWESEDGTQLFDLGFRMAAIYNTGNAQRQTIAELLQAGFQEAGEQFQIETIGLPWPTYLSSLRASRIPMFIIGWRSDYADTHNWVQPFTVGYYAGRQNFPDEVIQVFRPIAVEGVQMADPVARDAFYKEEFNETYHELAPAILLFSVKSRHYGQRYEQGWYTNPGYGGKWYYSLSKS